jgi:hypothetical protein
MDDRARKLLIAGVAAALFVGFIFFTRWSGDDPDSVESLGDQDLSNLEQFCFVMNSSFMSYDVMLPTVAGLATAEGGLPVDTPAARGIAESFLIRFVDDLPDKFTDKGAVVAEGLEKALDGDLEPDEVERYVAAFEDLQAESASDCADVGVPSFDEGGSFDDGSFGDIDTETTVP